MKLVVSFLLLLFSIVAAAPIYAADWWVAVPCCSYHKDRDKAYNEDNWGLGVEYVHSKSLSGVLLTYPNSFNDRTWSFGGVWSPEMLQMNIKGIVLKPGLFGGGFTGYEKGKVSWAVAPSLQIEINNRVGGNFLISDVFIGFAFKFNTEIF